MRVNVLALPRDLFLSAILIWLTNPYQDFIENWYIYGALWIGWIIFAILANERAFSKAFFNKASLVAFSWPIAVCLLSLFGWANFALYQFTIPFLLLSFGYYVVGDCTKSLKFFVMLYIGYAAIININSIIALEANGEISRILANSDKSITAQYASPTMANFQHVNNMAIFGVACLACVKYNQNRIFSKVLLLAVAVNSIILLVSAQYSIALFSFVIFAFIILYSNYKNKTSIAKVLLTCIVLFVVMLFVGSIISNIASNMSSGYVQRRLKSIGSLLSGGGMDTNSDLYSRLYLYTLSIKTFFSNLIFGVGGAEQYANGLVGGHSTILDNFAYYGVLFGSLFVYYIIASIKNVVGCFQGEYKKVMKTIFVMFILFMLLNTCYSEQMLYAIFFVYPALVFVVMKKTETTQCVMVKSNED